MSSVVLSGDSSGTVTLTVPSAAGTNTITLPAATGTAVVAGQNSAITAGTAVAATSGTSIDFTSIPSWVKRITILTSQLSQTAAGNTPIVQIGSGSFTTSGYTGASSYQGVGTNGFAVSNGFAMQTTANAADAMSGIMVIALLNSSTNLWVASFTGGSTISTGYTSVSGGNVTLSGVLDRVRITTANGTATFDSGSVNIFYE